MRAALSLVAVALLLPSAPAFAGQKFNEKGEKVICKTERFVGSHLSQRVCKTQNEWDNARKQSQDALDRFNGKLRNDPPVVSGG